MLETESKGDKNARGHETPKSIRNNWGIDAKLAAFVTTPRLNANVVCQRLKAFVRARCPDNPHALSSPPLPQSFREINSCDGITRHNRMVTHALPALGVDGSLFAFASLSFGTTIECRAPNRGVVNHIVSNFGFFFSIVL